MIVKRVIAGIIDYLVILVYAFLLLLATISLFSVSDFSLSPIEGQLIGFLSLTLPVYLFHCLMEKSVRKATLGKRFMKLRVEGEHIWLRNALKFLPWELAHTGVHWLIYFENQEIEPTLWAWLFPIGAQLLALIFYVSILLTKGSSSVYDKWAKTKVVLVS